MDEIIILTKFGRRGDKLPISFMEWDLTISSGNKSVLSPRIYFIYFMVGLAENGSFNNLDTISASSANDLCVRYCLEHYIREGNISQKNIPIKLYFVGFLEARSKKVTTKYTPNVFKIIFLSTLKFAIIQS